MESPRQKRVLGITGNIASGKSYVRQYLENGGAVTVDADLLAQETYLPGNPAYQPVLEAFGSDLKMPDGQISRGKLGRIVFRDADALAQLEKIIHPIVRERARQIIEDSDATLVVLEAIKLFESAMDQDCNQIWVVDADEKTRLERLMTTRGLEEKEAWRRIQSQPPQAEKIARAHRVIHTDHDRRGNRRGDSRGRGYGRQSEACAPARDRTLHAGDQAGARGNAGHLPSCRD